MSRESGLYAPGTEFSPSAPWNETEPDECPDCEGTGDRYGRAHGEKSECPTCHGDGIVEPDPDEGPDPDDLRDAALDREDDRYEI